MSIVDKVIAAVTPAESEQKRQDARAKAAALAEPGDWLSLVLEHHLQLEDAMAAVEQADTEEARAQAFRAFAVLLVGHSGAEEVVLYPSLSENAQSSHATHGYTEQAQVKIQMAALEKLPPISRDFEEKFAKMKEAILHHMHEEEGDWFPDLKQRAAPAEQQILLLRFAEEFDRYIGDTGMYEDEAEDGEGTDDEEDEEDD